MSKAINLNTIIAAVFPTINGELKVSHSNSKVVIDDGASTVSLNAPDGAEFTTAAPKPIVLGAGVTILTVEDAVIIKAFYKGKDEPVNEEATKPATPRARGKSSPASTGFRKAD